MEGGARRETKKLWKGGKEVRWKGGEEGKGVREKRVREPGRVSDYVREVRWKKLK
jgi:hypothetical protein